MYNQMSVRVTANHPMSSTTGIALTKTAIVNTITLLSHKKKKKCNKNNKYP